MAEVEGEADAGRDRSFASLWLLRQVMVSIESDSSLQKACVNSRLVE
jgi:hypothetical protein